MTISTYQELKVAIQDWSKRSDTLSLLDTFIDLAEAEMYANAEEPLRLRDMETSTTGVTSITTRYMNLPTRYLAFKRLKLNLTQGDLRLQFSPIDQMRISPTAGLPKFFTVGSQVEFDRISDQVYTVGIDYYQSLTPLSDAAPTNAILTRFPTIYLWGALSALWQWGKKLDESDYYYKQFLGAIAKANLQDRRGRYGPAPTIRMEGPTP